MYSRQLDNLNEAVFQKHLQLIKHKGVVFHHDNARPDTHLATCQKLLELGQDVLSHPAYLPDLALSELYIFCSLQNSLHVITLNSDEAVYQHLIQFFENKDRSF